MSTSCNHLVFRVSVVCSKTDFEDHLSVIGGFNSGEQTPLSQSYQQKLFYFVDLK